MKKKSEAEKIFNELSKKDEDFAVELKLGRRNHLSAKDITTLRLNDKGRLTIPSAIAEKKLFLSEFAFYKVGFDKESNKLYLLFVKEEDDKTKKFFRYKQPKTKKIKNEAKTCYVEISPQLAKIGVKSKKTCDVPINLKETKKGLLVLDISLLFPAT